MPLEHYVVIVGAILTSIWIPFATGALIVDVLMKKT